MTARTVRRRRPDATRAELLRTARELFATDGYEKTGTEDIVGRANLTRGALYHHFADKEELFRAVVEETIEEVVTSLGESTMRRESGDAWSQDIAGMQAYLDACLQPDRAQILLVDAPAILGMHVVVEISERVRDSVWNEKLRTAMRTGSIARLPVPVLGHLLAVLVEEAGMYVIQSDKPVKARREVRDVLARIFDGLRS